MRLWSIHPKYLDARGLVSAWREGLLAQKVLNGQTRGYVNHPQLNRFKKHSHPDQAIGYYLQSLFKESVTRGYKFDSLKINFPTGTPNIEVTDQQIAYEWKLLNFKLKTRDPKRYEQMKTVVCVQINSLFKEVKGPIAEWERVKEMS